MTQELVILLADVHANTHALGAVRRDVIARYNGQRFVYWFLGDLFGRGPEPIQIWTDLMRLKPEASVAGNHDWAISGRIGNFHPFPDAPHIVAGDINEKDWIVLMEHRHRLGRVQKEFWPNGAKASQKGEVNSYINQLPVVHSPRSGIYIVHGGWEHSTFTPPDDPQELWAKLIWGYVKVPQYAEATFAALQWMVSHIEAPEFTSATTTREQPGLVIVGHWHRRRLYVRSGGETPEYFESVTLNHPYPLAFDSARPILLSPGSVGFSTEPGDRNASYAVLQLENGQPCQVIFHTVAYDRSAVRQRMSALQYPVEIIRRLCLPGECD